MGTPPDEKRVVPAEEAARSHARRSIFTSIPVRAGNLISEDVLIAKRPGHGLSPLEWNRVVGRVATADLPEDHMIQWSDLQ